MYTFPTIEDALAAGYRKPRRGGALHHDRDISGGNSFGYAYEEPGTGRRTVTVTLTEERNRLGRPGCFAALFPPSDEDQPCSIEEAQTIASAAGVETAIRTSRRCPDGYLVLRWTERTGLDTTAEQETAACLETRGMVRSQCAKIAERSA